MYDSEMSLKSLRAPSEYFRSTLPTGLDKQQRNSRFQRVAVDCAAKDKLESDSRRTGTMRRESETMGLQACPAFLSDE
ncbi:hypothetical protein PoB_003880600 [Plakobranchus ocellatus]|uniref:Uncharacterized protein n=1 Tax=Plakobranchus ocellatus TaxID=259542 RepID=A0AAV4B0G7_9GAST|nr:hypothetical protein PoB_003880600 [Plakobranchus ocellatus]